MIEKITSLQNSRIKNLVHLSKSRERREQHLIIIEGYREITMANSFGYDIKELFYAPEVSKTHEKVIHTLPQTCRIVEITKTVFEKVAYRDNSDGLIALAVPIYFTIEELILSENPLIVVLESVEKPGNLGAILRTADAAAIDAIIVCDLQTDIYNPNVIRSSLGCIFSKQVAMCTSGEAMAFLKKKGVKTFAAALTASKFYHETDLKGPSAIVMGTEADGLTDQWLKGADAQIKIPMCGKVDSLNVSTSAAILMFEAKRQRGFN